MSLLDVSDLTVRFGGLRALEDVSFKVEHGEVLAILGPNGCGKTTLLNALSGFVKASGSIRIDGRDIVRCHSWLRARGYFGRTMQVPRRFEGLSLEENLSLANWATMQPTGASAISRALQTARSLLVPLGRPPQVAAASPGVELSVEVQIRRVFEGPATRVVLLDEPFAGQAFVGRQWILGRIREAKAASPSAMLIVEHHVKTILPIVDRILALERGRVVYFGLRDKYDGEIAGS